MLQLSIILIPLFLQQSSKSLEQDTSLQITGQQQENRGMDEAVDWRVGDAKVNRCL